MDRRKPGKLPDQRTRPRVFVSWITEGLGEGRSKLSGMTLRRLAEWHWNLRTGMLFYKVGLHGGAAALTDRVANIRSFLAWEPAGRYAIDALTGQSRWFGSRSSHRWGCAIKHEDGRIEFLKAENEECPLARLATIPAA